MFIREISSFVADSWGRVLKQRQTYGVFKNYHIGIEESIYKGKTLSKTFLIWNENMERLVKKRRNENGKFEIVG